MASANQQAKAASGPSDASKPEKMETELAATRRELASTKTALKQQTQRCRHLMSAFTAKLGQKDAELCALKELRERQLTSLLRALLILEARLRKEQKGIRSLLAEKDNLINEQRLEIEALRAEVKRSVLREESERLEETSTRLEEEAPREETAAVSEQHLAKPDLISSLGISEAKDSDSSDTASTRSCLGDGESDYSPPVLCPPRVLPIHDRSAFSPISSRMKEASSKQLQQQQQQTQDYQDNPVLQCVNQILLKDQEDFLEERRRVKAAWDEEDCSPEEEDPPQLSPTKPKKKSGKRVEFDIRPQFLNPPPVLPPPALDPGLPLPLPLGLLDQAEQTKDDELYVISNSALDDEIVKQLRGRTLNVTGLQLKGLGPRKHSSVPLGLLHPDHHQQQQGHETTSEEEQQSLYHRFTSPQPKQVLKVNIQESPKRSSFGTSPPKVGMPDTIKVASPVATLLTSEGPSSDSPTVSQMVRRFEEITVKKPEEGEQTSAGEKKEEAEHKSPGGSVSYDNFLEATGLSQKSIMTPSRLMTNHRSVMRPKDVKLRSRVKAAGVLERCGPSGTVVGPTVKYWTEPYL